MCMSPLLMHYDLDNCKYVIANDFINRNVSKFRYVIVPCGRCPECRRKWRTQLARRVKMELDKYDYNQKCFITLTCREEMIDEVFPGYSLDHTYFQKFMKRLRRYLEYHGIPHKKLKYLISGEYGTHNTHRPHFHLILFGWKPADLKASGRSKKGYQQYKSKFLEELWGAGFVEVGDVDEHTAPYMVKYMVKYSEVKQEDEVIKEVIDDETGEIKTVKERVPFTVLGREVRKPYIVYPKTMLGLDYFLDHFEQMFANGFIYDSRGRKLGIPRSFLKYADKQPDDSIIKIKYLEYKERCMQFVEESKIPGDYYGFHQYEKAVEQGKVRRLIYTVMKDNTR